MNYKIIKKNKELVSIKFRIMVTFGKKREGRDQRGTQNEFGSKALHW